MILSLSVNQIEDIYLLGNSLHPNFSNLYDYMSLNVGADETYVYLDNLNVVGFIHIQLTCDELSVIDVVVDPRYRRKGIGKELMEYVISKYNHKRIILEVAANNTSAIKFYKSLGFVKFSERKGYYRGVNAILMERK